MLLTTNRRTRLIVFGNIYLLAYAILAIIFYKERIFLDGSYYFFHVVQSQMFHVEHQRFILIASQILPVIGSNLHLPLSMLLILNSLNPVIYLWVLYLLSVFLLKDEAIAWALLLSSVCGIYYIWFCPMYEVWYGCVLLIFFAGLLENNFYKTLPQQVLFTLVLIALLFSYPLIFIGVVFFTVLHFGKLKAIPLRITVIYGAVFLMWLIWKYFFISDYETGKISYPLSQIGATLKHNFSSPDDFGNLISFLLKTYPEEILMMILSAGILFAKRRTRSALFMIFMIAAFVFLINITQDHPWHGSNYFERMYLLLVPLCIVPFIQNLFAKIFRARIVAEAGIALILVIRLTQIVIHAEEYKMHIKTIESMIHEASDNGGSKYIIDLNKHPEFSDLDEWSLPMETLIFSSLDSVNSVTISWKSDILDPAIASHLNDSIFRLRLDELYPDRWLNQHYFHLKDGHYTELY